MKCEYAVLQSREDKIPDHMQGKPCQTAFELPAIIKALKEMPIIGRHDNLEIL